MGISVNVHLYNMRITLEMYQDNGYGILLEDGKTFNGNQIWLHPTDLRQMLLLHEAFPVSRTWMVFGERGQRVLDADRYNFVTSQYRKADEQAHGKPKPIDEDHQPASPAPRPPSIPTDNTVITDSARQALEDEGHEVIF